MSAAGWPSTARIGRWPHCPLPPICSAAVAPLAWEGKLGSKIEECLTIARRCEALANEARDILVRSALMHAAQQWRSRARSLGQHDDASFAGVEPHRAQPREGFDRL